MENNTDNTVTIQTETFKQSLVKLAVATIAATLAKKAAEGAVDWMRNRNQTVTIETAN